VRSARATAGVRARHDTLEPLDPEAAPALVTAAPLEAEERTAERRALGAKRVKALALCREARAADVGDGETIATPPILDPIRLRAGWEDQRSVADVDAPVADDA
jgi:hypothetical protein